MAGLSWGSFEPFADLLQLQSALDRLLQNPALGLNLGPSSASVFPPLNIFVDREGAVVVCAEIPGVDPNALQIEVEPQRLTISGERRAPDGGRGYHRRERRFGRFSRAVQLPAELDPDRTSAEYRDGMLRVRIEKSAASRPRTVTVEAR